MNMLIVDDERPMVDFLEQAARSKGITAIDAAFSGGEALTRIIQCEYDLITLDIRMPEVSGLEIISVLRSMCPHSVIAVISGYIPPDIDEDTMNCVDALIIKPISLKDFGRLVDAAGKISAAREEIRSLGIASNWRTMD